MSGLVQAYISKSSRFNLERSYKAQSALIYAITDHVKILLNRNEFETGRNGISLQL